MVLCLDSPNKDYSYSSEVNGENDLTNKSLNKIAPKSFIILLDNILVL